MAEITAKTPLETLDYNQANNIPNANTQTQQTGNPVSSTTPPVQQTTSPAVISAAPATDKAIEIQGNMSTKMADQASISAAKQNLVTSYDAQGNMIKTGGKMSNGNTYQELYPKGSPGYIQNPADIKAQQEQQQNASLTQAAGTTPTNQNAPQTNLPSSVQVPGNINPAITSDQVQFYNQNPDQFDQWAHDQNWSEEQITNVHYQASIEKYNQMADSAKADLDKFAQGTYPLTSAQQAQLDATKQQFDNLISQQRTTNQNYENGVRILGNVTGRSQYFPDIAMGEVQSAINSGLQKVGDLQSKEASTLAQMEEGFQTDNFKMVNDAHNTLLNIEKSIVDNMKGVHDSIVAAQKDARDFNYRLTQDNITNTLNSDKFTWQQKVDQVDAQIRQSGLDETKRHNLAQEAETLVSQGLNNSGNLPTVNMTSSGLPDKAGQAAFLAQFPQDLQTTIKQIADYKQSPTSISTRQYKGVGAVNRQQVLSWVAQYDPTYNEAQYASRQALLAKFTSGDYSKNINALNTAIGHINDLTDNFDKLHNTNFTPYNQAINSWKKASGYGGVTSAEQNINAVANELATAFKASGATDSEIKSWQDTLNTSSSPAQAKAFIETASNLLNSRLEALNATYESGMGKPKDGGFLSDKNQQALLDLKAKGYDIKVDELANSPYVKIQVFHDLSPQNAQIIDQLKQLAPNATPQEIIDELAQNGVSL